jgi:hypothetical protein
MNINDVVGLAQKSVKDNESNLRERLLSFLRLYIPEPIIDTMHIENHAWKFDGLMLDSSPDEFRFNVEVEGLPLFEVIACLKSGEWLGCSYKWTEIVLDKEYRVIATGAKRSWNSDGSGVVYASHEYTKENFLIAFGKAVEFAKKMGTYKE